MNPANQLIQLVRRGFSFSGNERNCVFLNTKQQRFANISGISGIGFPDDARAIGRVDWDADGDLDLWITNRNAPQIRFLRNDLENDHDWISLQLTGSKSNRDAIGARIEVILPDQGDRPIIRTLHCGDGYLTQSSKTIHIGLGNLPSRKPIGIRIRWPSGWKSNFSTLHINNRYRLREDSTEPELFDPHRPKSPLQKSRSQLPLASDASSVSSFVRPFLPRLPYKKTNGQSDLIQNMGTPTLVVLWASWCPICLQELADLSDRYDELRQSGLKIIALCVDDLTPSQSGKTIDAAKFPFEFGTATAALVDQLQLYCDQLFILQKPFPVPVSTLIDKDFRMASLYRGKLKIETLKADLSHLHSSVDVLRNRSVPFPGIWISEPTSLPMSFFVLDLINQGYLEDASELVQRIQQKFRKSTILQLVVRLGVAYYKSGEMDRAELHFQMARKIQPNTVGPEIELGQFHESQREFQVAKSQYENALKINPNSLPALNNLAWLLASCSDKNLRNGAMAVNLAGRAVKLTQGRNPEVLDTLAAGFAEVGNFKQAIAICDQAIQIANGRSKFNLAGKIEQRRRSYVQQMEETTKP